MRKAQKTFIQFFKFCVVGVSNAIVYYLFYTSILFLFQKGQLFCNWDYEISHFLSFFISVLWAYWLNRFFVFQKKDGQIFHSMWKFYSTYIFTGLILNSVLLYIWCRFGISEYFAPLLNVVFVTPINYLLSKTWVFRNIDKNDW
jgi:putative flippase GtrA